MSCFISGWVQAQDIYDSATLRTAINTDIVANGSKQITGPKLNRILNGLLNLWDANSSSLVNPGPITSLPKLGFAPGTTDVGEWINRVFYQSADPTATLTGGVQLELMAAGATLPFTLNWTAGRQLGTATLGSVVVNGVTQSISQPAAPGTISGTQTVAVTRNQTGTFNMTVTTTDSKTVTASTTFTFLPKRYFGWVTNTVPTDADILATASELTASNAKTWTQNAPGGSKYLMFAYPASAGNLTHIDINGFPSIEAFKLTTRSLTNALGHTQSYNIYTSINAFTVTGTTSIVVY
jgi:hypothetical protein